MTALRNQPPSLLAALNAAAAPTSATPPAGAVAWIALLAAGLGLADGIRGSVGSLLEFSAVESLGHFAAAGLGCFAGLLVGLLLVARAGRLLPARPRLRWSLLAMVVVAATAVAVLVDECASSALYRFLPEEFWMRETWWPTTAREWLQTYSDRIAPIALYAVLFEFVQIEALRARELQQAQLQQIRHAGEVDEARLGLLRAQIDPHFLFNSLANLRRLMRTDPAAGAAMLTDLRAYLQLALPALRSDASTLGREAGLAAAFLAVHKVRLGARLEVSVDVPAHLATWPMPPMMLLTLIENALKHGLATLPEGGRIDVAAVEEGDVVRVTVSDNGVGIRAGPSSGTGLANIRMRLRSLHGGRAELRLQGNAPRGVVATLTLPRPAS